MALTVYPRPFAVTEYAFTISLEFDAGTVGWVQYSNESSFANSDKVGGSSDYGFNATADDPCVHLVPIDPSIAGPGDMVYYRLKTWDGSSFTDGEVNKVRLRRPRSDYMGWSFIVMPNARDNAAGSGLHANCNNYFLPTINSMDADFICCPGGIVHDPNPGAGAASISFGEYRLVRQDFEAIDIPIYLSPGDNENESTANNRWARHRFFPCANLRTSGHQCIRTNQDDWQQSESSSNTSVSQGSYYHFTWGNALFIHFNEWLDDNSFSGGDPDLNEPEYGPQKAWLEAVLKEHRHKYKWCFLFTHSSVDEDDPDANPSISQFAGKTYFTDSTTGIHVKYKISAHFHGQYNGWRVATDSNGTTFVCCTGGQSTTATASGTWHNQQAFARVNIGMDENRNVDPDKVKVDIVAVGLTSGTNTNEILNTSSSNSGVISAPTGNVVDHTDTSVSISDLTRSARVISLGSEWVYNDNNHPVNDDVDFITGSTKFYDPTFLPEMYSPYFSGTATAERQLWKSSTSPFEANAGSSSNLSSSWGYVYGDHIKEVGVSDTSIDYQYPEWQTKTNLTTFSVSSVDYCGNPLYYIKRFDIPDNIEPTEVELIYNIKDVAFIWINGELAHHTSGIGIPQSTDVIAPYARTRRPSVSESWVEADSGSTLSTFNPYPTDNDGGDGVGGVNAEDSRTKLPTHQYEFGEQPVKISNPTVINKLKYRNNVIAVLIVNGRDSSSVEARYSKQSAFDLSLTVVGSEKTTMFAPHITAPEKLERFNQGIVNITWDINDPPSTSSNVTSDTVTYEIEYTDNYQGSETNWHTVKRRIPYSSSSYTWTVGKSIKSNSVRIRMRSKSSFDESVSNWTVSDQFSVNVFELIAPAIISPLPKVLYSDFILIILDESLTRNTYHQKVRYTLEYYSKKRGVNWTTIATNVPVGQNIIRWNLDGVASSDDYILRLTAKNTSTSCLETPDVEPDQIARRFVHDVKVQQSGMFLIDTKPPEAVLEIDQNTGVTNQLDQIINIFAQDETSDIANIRMRECDAGSTLALGDLEDPYDPLGGCTDLVEIVQDLDKFGKPNPINPKAHWTFEDSSGLKKIEALLTDIGGNTSLQEQVKVFLNTFTSTSLINDFIIVIEQRDKIIIDDSQSPPTVTAEPSIFEVVYFVTSDRELWILEPFARLVWTLDASIEPKLLVEFNETVYVLTFNSSEDEGRIYKNNTTEPELLYTFTDAGMAGRNLPTAVAVFNNKLYVGMESGVLWSYNGLSFAHLLPPVSAPISSLFGDNQYLHIGFENSESLVLYNGTDFVTLDLE